MAINLRRTDSASQLGSVGRTEATQKTAKVDDDYGMTQTVSTGARAGRGAGARGNPLTAIRDFFTKTIPNFFKSLFGGGGGHAVQRPTATFVTTQEGVARSKAMEQQEKVDLSAYKADPQKTTRNLAEAVLHRTDPKVADAAEHFLRHVTFAAENLDFLRAVEEYRSNPTARKAQEIMEEFIGVDSRQNVNIYDDAVETTQRNVEAGRLDGREFDVAFGRAHDNLVDSMGKFQKHNDAL